jgi:hypothetical protein
MIWKFNEIKKWRMKLPKQKSIKKRTQNKRSCNHKNEDQIKKKEIIIKKN